MPLKPGRANIGANIAEMEAAGHPRDQSVAAALRVAGVPKNHPHRAAAGDAEHQYDPHASRIAHVDGHTVYLIGSTAEVYHSPNPASGRRFGPWRGSRQVGGSWRWEPLHTAFRTPHEAELPPRVTQAFWDAVKQLAPESYKHMARPGIARHYAQKPATSESFIAALKDMKGRKQAARREVAHAVATQAGIAPHTFHDAIHDRVDGRATPSVVHHYPNAPSAQTARYSAAWFGLITGLEGVAVFFPDPKGPDFLYEFHAQGSGEMLRQRLDRAGIGDRVLMPKRGGFTVMVLDQGGTMGDRVRRYAGGNVTAMRGRAERMGGDNPVQARDEYRKLIKGYEGAAQKSRVRGDLRRYSEHQYDPLAEERALANGAKSGPAERLVYADWLAEHGHPEHEAVSRVLAGRKFHGDGNWVRTGTASGDGVWFHADGGGRQPHVSIVTSPESRSQRWQGFRSLGGKWQWRRGTPQGRWIALTPSPHVTRAFWDAAKQMQRGK